MRFLIFLIYLSISLNSFCQETGKLKTSFNISTHFRSNYYFSKTEKNTELYQLESTSQIGISNIIALLVNRKYLTYGMYELSYIIPHKTTIFDTISVTQRGFNFSANVLGHDLLLKKQNFDFIISLGFNTGRVWFNGNEIIRQKNGYFAPKVEILPRLIQGKFCIYGLFQVGYDITNSNWKRKGFSDLKQLNLTNYKNNEYSISFGIGYVI